MKKTIITVIALSGMATAADTYSDVLTLPETSTFWSRDTSGAGLDGFDDRYANTNIAACAGKVFLAFVAAPNIPDGGANALYYACANGNDNVASGDVTIASNQDGSIGFTMEARGGNAGEYVALTLPHNTIYEGRESDKDILTGITFSFTSSLAKGAYSAWGYTKGESQVTLLGEVKSTAADTNTLTLTAEQVKDLDRVIFVIGNEATKISVTNLKVTSTFTVPEPATATLSLLALAGLAARRRRK